MPVAVDATDRIGRAKKHIKLKAFDDAHAVESLREALAKGAAEHTEEPGTKLEGLPTERKHLGVALCDIRVEGLLRWRGVSRYTQVPVRLPVQTTIVADGHP